MVQSSNVAMRPSSNLSDALAVSIRDACRITGLARSSIYREIAAGRIKAVKSGKRTLLPTESLRAWLDALPQSKRAGFPANNRT